MRAKKHPLRYPERFPQAELSQLQRNLRTHREHDTLSATPDIRKRRHLQPDQRRSNVVYRPVDNRTARALLLTHP
jgi:hypothetical protein